jgi:hypothetical protein
LATGVAPACAEPGPTVGNRPAALPPGLTLVVGNAPPRGMVDSVSVGFADAETTIEAAAAGFVARLAALPVTVRPTDVTVVAVSGTVTSACNCRCAEVASTAHRSHTDVPLPVPQPKLKTGIPAPGVDCSWTLTSGTLPPVVQAPTTHWDACPRAPLGCRGATPTHTLTGVVLAVAWKAVKTMARPEAPVVVALVVAVPVGDDDGDDDGD